MIKIENQVIYVFSIGDVSDFITPTNLNSFRMYETAGNLRPIIELNFKLENEKIIKYLNAGNILSVTFGISELQKDVIQYELFGDSSNLDASVGYNVNIKGAFYQNNFTAKTSYKSYGKTSSIDVLQQIADTYKFNLITNITKTDDKQYWDQSGKTPWQFLTEIWKNSFINENTFTALAIDATNIYFYDVNQLVKSGTKWEFNTNIYSKETSNIIPFNAYTIKNNFGLVGDLIGKNLITKTYNVDTGEFTEDSYNLKSFTTLDTDKININSTDCKSYNYEITTSSVHDNYTRSHNQNIRNNIMYSTFNIYLTTAGQFKRVKLLDTAAIKTDPQDRRIEGTCFITSIVYQFENGALLTNLTLNKESASGIRGDNLETSA